MCLAMMLVRVVQQDARHWEASIVGPLLPTMTDSVLAPGRAHRTACPTNTGCSDRIIWGLYCLLDNGGGGYYHLLLTFFSSSVLCHRTPVAERRHLPPLIPPTAVRELPKAAPAVGSSPSVRDSLNATTWLWVTAAVPNAHLLPTSVRRTATAGPLSEAACVSLSRG